MRSQSPDSHTITLESSPEFAMQLRNVSNNQGMSIGDFVSKAVEYGSLVVAADRNGDKVEGVMQFSDDVQSRLGVMTLLLASQPAAARAVSAADKAVERTEITFSGPQSLGLEFAITGETIGSSVLIDEASRNERIAARITHSVQLYVSRIRAEETGWSMVVAPGVESDYFLDLDLSSGFEAEHE